MNRIGGCIISIVAVMTWACGTSEDRMTTEFDAQKISDEASRMLEVYHADMNREGLMAEFKYLDSSETFFWVPPGYKSALDYDSVRAILETNAKTLRAVKFSWDTLQIFPLSNTIATYAGIVNGEMTDTAGTTTHMSIIESGTVIKREDGWKLLSGQSAVLPGTE